MCATLRPEAAQKLSAAACVRWKEPGDELLGLARVAHALVDRDECRRATYAWQCRIETGRSR